MQIYKCKTNDGSQLLCCWFMHLVVKRSKYGSCQALPGDLPRGRREVQAIRSKLVGLKDWFEENSL